MIIGALRLTFVVPPDGKSTRSTSQKIKDHLWARFKIAVAEIPASGAELVIGGALVGSEEAKVQDRLQQIVQHLRDWGAVELVDDETEIIRYEDLEMERDFEKYES